MKKSSVILIIALLLVSSLSPTTAGPFLSAICYTGCNALVVACYAASGFTFGIVTVGSAVPAVIIACKAGLGVCMAATQAAAVAPTP